ncbi:MAG: hypothetical protein P4L22_02960 [Candidatus Babeliales bacterium]|nr:hypothetical protein [Candidatus Babeliales bacterium]
MKMKLTLLLFASICAMQINANVVIWDVGDTLLTSSAGSSFNQMGMFNTSAYVLDFLVSNKLSFKKLKPHMRDLFLDTLALIPCPLNNPDNGALSVAGKPLPALLRENLLGTLSGKEVLQISNAWTEANKSYFKNSRQRTIFERTLRICFDPETSLKTLTKTKHFGLLKQCYQATGVNGKRKNTCVILSNWSSDKLGNLKNNFKDVFEYSDGQVFSCEEKLLKPATKLFEKCLKFKKNKNEKVILIDDQEENRKAAEKFGIIAVHPDYALKTLKEHSII